MIEFVFMLTHHDRTDPDPAGVYQQVRPAGLRYVGFKDVGASVTQLTEVCARAREDGLEVMLEVVSTTREEELRSVAAAAEIGVDWLLGGTHPEDGLKVLNGAATGRVSNPKTPSTASASSAGTCTGSVGARKVPPR